MASEVGSLALVQLSIGRQLSFRLAFRQQTL